MTAVLTCHFLFDLREADRSTAPPSSPSALPSLHIAGDSPEGSRGALPPFIASMGSQVHAPGLRFLGSDSTAMAEDDTRGEGVADEQGAAWGEDEMGVSETMAWERGEVQENI